MTIPKLVMLLAFENSRKVGFGLWLFIAAGIFLVKGLIDADKWILCIGLVTALIGGGTIADAWMGKKVGKNDPPAPPVQ